MNTVEQTEEQLVLVSPPSLDVRGIPVGLEDDLLCDIYYSEDRHENGTKECTVLWEKK